jgi:enoyl-CoA hydratase/carnithine racemase
MAYENILYEAAAGVATITLNRPDRLNAWNTPMERELRQAVETAAADDGVRVILLTGAGRGFCAGADIERLDTIAGGTQSWEKLPEPKPMGGSERADFRHRVSYFPLIGKPVIAVVNGPVAGIGLVLALYCDLRFAGSDAVFVSAFARRGLIAEYGAGWMLSRLVGPANALDLLMSSRRVTAEEALRMGLVNQVFPQAELMARAHAYAAEVASACSPRSLRVIKRQVWDAQFETLAEAQAVADREMEASFRSEDFREGVAHFQEKRPPRFTGR